MQMSGDAQASLYTCELRRRLFEQPAQRRVLIQAPFPDIRQLRHSTSAGWLGLDYPAAAHIAPGAKHIKCLPGKEAWKQEAGCELQGRVAVLA
mmetsp:Transcript_6988/g.16746  ORF Transcript_6988/g.16746 Transcript_6988/m.16746 type:complete len:93 (-) Transcript_6988:1804-2082(-)